MTKLFETTFVSVFQGQCLLALGLPLGDARPLIGQLILLEIILSGEIAADQFAGELQFLLGLGHLLLAQQDGFVKALDLVLPSTEYRSGGAVAAHLFTAHIFFKIHLRKAQFQLSLGQVGQVLNFLNRELLLRLSQIGTGTVHGDLLLDPAVHHLAYVQLTDQVAHLDLLALLFEKQDCASPFDFATQDRSIAGLEIGSHGFADPQIA